MNVKRQTLPTKTPSNSTNPSRNYSNPYPKAESIPLKFDEMRSYLDLRWSNDRGVHAAFASAFDDMIDKGLLEGYTVRGKPVARRVYTLKFPHREKKKVRKDGDAKLLKFADYKA
jgi:hypothetical protein